MGLGRQWLASGGENLVQVSGRKTGKRSYVRSGKYAKKKKELAKAAVSKNAETAAIAKTVKEITTKVKKLETEQELKHVTAIYCSYDNSTATTTLTTSNPYTLLLNGLARGTSYVQRIGDTVRGTSIRCSGRFYLTSVSNVPGADFHVKLMIVKQMRPQGQAMLLYGPPPLAAGTTPLYAQSAAGKYPTIYQYPDIGILANPHFEYKIEHQEIFHFKPNPVWYNGTNPQTTNPELLFNMVIPISTISDYSRSQNGNITDIESNAYYFVAICDTTSNVTLELDSVFYFKDA